MKRVRQRWLDGLGQSSAVDVQCSEADETNTLVAKTWPLPLHAPRVKYCALIGCFDIFRVFAAQAPACGLRVEVYRIGSFSTGPAGVGLVCSVLHLQYTVCPQHRQEFADYPWLTSTLNCIKFTIFRLTKIFSVPGNAILMEKRSLGWAEMKDMD